MYGPNNIDITIDNVPIPQCNTSQFLVSGLLLVLIDQHLKLKMYIEEIFK